MINLDHDEQRLKTPMFKPGNSKQVLAELQTAIDRHEGKDLRVEKYGMKPEYAEDLEKL